MMECIVCCNDTSEDYTVSCPYCEYTTCHECAEKYITNTRKAEEPSCMKCRKIWNRTFVMKGFPKEWVRTTFHEHLSLVLLESEKALLPDTQTEAMNVAKVRDLSAKIKALPSNHSITRKYKNDKELLQKKLEEKRSLRMRLVEEMNNLKRQTITYSNNTPTPKSKTYVKPQYIMKCPQVDCRGYIDTHYKCGTCTKSICERCHIALVSTSHSHTCNKDDIKSAALVIKETKPCPRCMTLIFKASGCNQMFCTQCHVIFDWSTGQIDDGIIHNPHYFEYLANNAGKTDIDINMERAACGELPRDLEYAHHMNVIRHRHPELREFKTLLNLIDNLPYLSRHTRNVVMPLYQMNRIRSNLDLRVQYLLGELEEDAWASRLLVRERKRMKFKDIYDLLHMTVVVIEDITRQIIATNSKNTILEIAIQVERLSDYYQEALKTINKVHGGGTPPDLNIWDNVILRY